MSSNDRLGDSKFSWKEGLRSVTAHLCSFPECIAIRDVYFLRDLQRFCVESNEVIDGDKVVSDHFAYRFCLSFSIDVNKLDSCVFNGVGGQSIDFHILFYQNFSGERSNDVCGGDASNDAVSQTEFFVVFVTSDLC